MGTRSEVQRTLKYAKGLHAGPATRGDQTSQKFGGCWLGGVDDLAPGSPRGLSDRVFPSGPAFVSRVFCPCRVQLLLAVAAAELSDAAEDRGHDGSRRRSAERRRDYGKRDVLPKAEADLPDAAATHGGLRLPLWRDALLGTADTAAQS